LALIAFVHTDAASAARGGGGGHGGGGFHGGGFHGGGFHGGGFHGHSGHGSHVSFGFGLGFYGPWYPYGWPYYDAYYPAYWPGYYNAPMYNYGAADAYPAQSYPVATAQPQPAEEAAWYYCAPLKGYYPYVSQCPEQWQRVPTVPPPGSDNRR
jgi:hypothetical protein